MKHSNHKNKEEEYAEINRQYKEEKLALLRDLRNDVKPEKKKKSSFRKSSSCCIGILLIAGLCLYVIYFFVSAIKDDVVKEYENKSQQIETMLPELKGEVKQGIEQGENLITDTKEKVDSAKETYDKAKNTYEDIQEFKDKVDDVINPEKEPIESEI